MTTMNGYLKGSLVPDVAHSKPFQRSLNAGATSSSQQGRGNVISKKKKKGVAAASKPMVYAEIPDWEKLQSQINIVVASVPNNTLTIPQLRKDVLETFAIDLNDAAHKYEYTTIQAMLSDMNKCVQIKHTHLGVIVCAAICEASAHVTEMIRKTKGKKGRKPNRAPAFRRPGYTSTRPTSYKSSQLSFGHAPSKNYFAQSVPFKENSSYGFSSSERTQPPSLSPESPVLQSSVCFSRKPNRAPAFRRPGYTSTRPASYESSQLSFGPAPSKNSFAQSVPFKENSSYGFSSSEKTQPPALSSTGSKALPRVSFGLAPSKNYFAQSVPYKENSSYGFSSSEKTQPPALSSTGSKALPRVSFGPAPSKNYFAQSVPYKENSSYGFSSSEKTQPPALSLESPVLQGSKVRFAPLHNSSGQSSASTDMSSVPPVVSAKPSVSTQDSSIELWRNLLKGRSRAPSPQIMEPAPSFTPVPSISLKPLESARPIPLPRSGSIKSILKSFPPAKLLPRSEAILYRR